VVPDKEWVSLAVLRRARGIRGELFAESMGSPLERFTPGLSVTMFAPDGCQQRQAEIESSWAHNGRLVLKLRGIDTRSGAEALQGWEVRIPLEERPPPPGEYYLSDLIGCEVFTRDARHLGTVTGWLDSGGPALLEVTKDNAEILVPLVPEICVEVDIGGRRITAQLPEGLEELNRA